MISRRNFFSIIIMMFILFFLFMFSMIMRDQENVYDVNAYVTENQEGSGSAWQQQTGNLKVASTDQEEYVVFVGKQNSEMYTAVARWCLYTKRNVVCLETIASVTDKLEKLPEMIVLQSEKVIQTADIASLRELSGHGVCVVFGELEDASGIDQNTELKDYLGISAIVSQNTEITGVRLFEGLLLGGETTYQATTKKEEERQDLDLNVPWYQVGSGTKAYMVGLLEEEQMQQEGINEKLPTLIWRHGVEGGSVFAVCGDFMKDSTALGLLDGMITEAKSYTIYPVINAQNLFFVNFPGFAEENADELQQMYSQSVTGIGRDIIWPSLISLAENSKMKMTCFLSPQQDYTDDIEPDRDILTFYQKQFKEQNTEAGISLMYKKADSFVEKLKKDRAFFSLNSYQYASAYAQPEQLTEIRNRQDDALIKNLNTIVADYNEDYPVVSYFEKNVTLQNVTSDGVNYTYSDDLRMRSVQSALGYTNIILDMKDVFWPEDADDGWEKIVERFSSNLLTFWKKFSVFDGTTISESDTRVRNFLRANYSESREDNVITLKTSAPGGYFLLRTHDETVEDISGGTYQMIEKNVYLIQTEETDVTIQLKGQDLYYKSSEQVK